MKAFNLALPVLAVLGTCLQGVLGERLIYSRSLGSCMKNSHFTAEQFMFTLTPENRTLDFSFKGISTVQGYVHINIEILAYGYKAFTRTLNPCDEDWRQLCPMRAGKLPELLSSMTVDDETLNAIPGVAYTIPDLDGKVRVTIKNIETNEQVACVEAPLSNGKTVEHPAAGWVTGAIASIGVLTSVVLVASGHGRSKAGAHVATYALSFLAYLQSQAIVGLTSVPLPPLAQGWTQNFQWSMGILRVGWMQDIFTWYIKATGGKPTNFLESIARVSVLVQRRSLDWLDSTDEPHRLVRRSAEEDSGILTLRGFDRVAYKASMERSNLFLTAWTFFVIFIVLVSLLTIAFKYGADFAAQKGWMKPEKFLRFRQNWRKFLKGALYQMLLIGFPQMSIMCIYEFTVRDSPAAVVLAVFYFIGITGTLSWATYNIVRASNLFRGQSEKVLADQLPTKILSRWSLLCVMFKKNKNWFIAPLLIYVLLKSIFVAVAQNSAYVQALALLILDLGYLVGICYVRPWLDKGTIICNIVICTINFLNAFMLLIFCGIFKSPGLVTGVFGVIFFVLNGIASLVLLFLVIWSTIKLIRHRNRLTPDSSLRSSLAGGADSVEPESSEQNLTSAGKVENASYRGLSTRGSVISNRKSMDARDTPVSRTSTRASKRERPPFQVGEVPPVPHQGDGAHGHPGPGYIMPMASSSQTAIERAWSRASSLEHRAHSPAYSHPHTEHPERFPLPRQNSARGSLAGSAIEEERNTPVPHGSAF